MTDFDILPEQLDPSLFPGIPQGVEVHSGFANEQARYAVLVAFSALHANNDDARKHRVNDPPLRPKYALDAKYLERHRRRPFSRSGDRPPRWRLLEPTAPKECDGECDHLRIATRREPSIRQFRRYPAERTRNAREQPGRPDPGPAPLFLGYHQPSGEIHIQDSGTWDACPGALLPSCICM